MNRENKRKQFEKGYYKNHPCQESFTCKVCGRLVTPEGAAAATATIVPTACPASTWMWSRETGPLTAGA